MQACVDITLSDGGKEVCASRRLDVAGSVDPRDLRAAAVSAVDAVTAAAVGLEGHRPVGPSLWCVVPTANGRVVVDLPFSEGFEQNLAGVASALSHAVLDAIKAAEAEDARADEEA